MTPPAFHGKQHDATADALRMALGPVGASPHLECLTGRPFALRCPTGEPGRWLSPWIGPWEGVRRALAVLGAETRTCEYRGDPGPFLADLARSAANGPVLVGPLDRRVLWDRVDARYHPAGAHFVLALGVGADGRLRVHDPEGVPGLPVSPSRLLGAFAAVGPPTGAVQVHGVASLDPREIVRRTTAAGQAVRVAAAGAPDGGASALAALALRLADRPLRSGEEAALFFALPALGLARARLARFILDAVPSLGAAVPLLARFAIGCGRALDAVRRRDPVRVSRRVRHLAYLERLLDAELNEYQ